MGHSVYIYFFDLSASLISVYSRLTEVQPDGMGASDIFSGREGDAAVAKETPRERHPLKKDHNGNEKTKRKKREWETV